MKVAANGRALVERLRQSQQLALLDQVDLVEHQHFGRADVAETAQDRFLVLLHALVRVDQQSDDFGVVRAAPGAADHGAVEPAAWRENAGRVDEDELRGAFDGDAADQRAGGLHFGRDDGDFGADQRVEQRRLAGIRRADQGDEAAARGWRRRLNHWRGRS